jgi:hypothetical protein
MKMQIAFRRLIGQKFAGYDVAAVVGLLDVESTMGDVDEHALDLMMKLSPDGTTPEEVTFTGNGLPLAAVAPGNIMDEIRNSEIGHVIKASIPRTRPSASSNANLFCRLTDVASSYDAGSVYAVAGVLCVDNVMDLNCRDVLELEAGEGRIKLALQGRVGRTLRRHFGETDLEHAMQGRKLDSFLEEPIWGFGNEPLALGSTLALDNQRMYEKYIELFFGDKDTEVSKRRYLQMRILAEKSGFTLLDEDPVLARMLWRARQNDDYVSPHSPRTRSQFHAANQAMNEAFAAIERGDDQDFFDEWHRNRDEGNDTEAVLRR